MTKLEAAALEYLKAVEADECARPPGSSLGEWYDNDGPNIQDAASKAQDALISAAVLWAQEYAIKQDEEKTSEFVDGIWDKGPITDNGVRDLHVAHGIDAFNDTEVCGRCSHDWGMHSGIDCADGPGNLLGTTFIPAGYE